MDISKLAPGDLAKHLGRPEGEVGKAVGEQMNRTNAGVTDAVYRRLGLVSGNHILEIGFGNGKLLPALLAQADNLAYTGVDFSETMVAEATGFNAGLVAAGRAKFLLGSVEALPLADQCIDRAFAVNGIYFWPDAVKALQEIRRALRADGLSLIAAITPETAATAPFMREEFGFRLRDGEAIAHLHREAGFSHVDVELYQEVVTRPDGLQWERHYSFVIGRP